MTAIDPQDQHADDELTARLRLAVTAADHPPTEVVDAAKAAFTWRTIDAELAELTYDSFVDADALVGVRGGDGPRQLSFERGELSLELEVVEVGGLRRLTGQVVSGPLAELSLQQSAADGSMAVPTDHLGRFHLDAVAAGPARFLFRLAGDVRTDVLTDWVTI
jgi:hypothetical protein